MSAEFLFQSGFDLWVDHDFESELEMGRNDPELPLYQFPQLISGHEHLSRP